MEKEACSCSLDIDLASKVQQLLLPKSSPLCSWCCIGVKNRMASGLGGDFFDFITMPDNCQAMFIGDVTGHSLHASVVMSLLYGFIHRSSLEICSPLNMVNQANTFLNNFAARSREFDHFFSATLFCGIVHPKTMMMHYVNAGHCSPLIKRGDKVIHLPPTAPPIGFFEDPEVKAETFQFQLHDRFLMYTDGITEAADAEEELFGRKRLEKVLLEKGGDHLEFLEEIFTALRDFGAPDPPRDDCTAIVTDFHQF